MTDTGADCCRIWEMVVCGVKGHVGYSWSSSPLDSELADLLDVNYSDNPFTWSNKRQGNELILKRIDRTFSNDNWFHFFPNSIVYHLFPFGSDHVPIMLSSTEDVGVAKKPFRFNKCMLRDDSCKQVISSHWIHDTQGSYAFKHSKSLSFVKIDLREWSYREMRDFNMHIKDEIERVNNLPHSIKKDVELLLDLNAKLKYWNEVQHDY
ncbi:uncharacterized protein LOC113305648 [Papaver somniferum]|uniref:uncharacterized protein LOC113305648 n=1 Tax=Papaver somniferum TaxID=3469 RepID=UPI000E7056FF|nr:uncharacterized protein LOC113305648 [Papaver somniferum]